MGEEEERRIRMDFERGAYRQGSNQERSSDRPTFRRQASTEQSARKPRTLKNVQNDVDNLKLSENRASYDDNKERSNKWTNRGRVIGGLGATAGIAFGIATGGLGFAALALIPVAALVTGRLARYVGKLETMIFNQKDYYQGKEYRDDRNKLKDAKRAVFDNKLESTLEKLKTNRNNPSLNATQKERIEKHIGLLEARQENNNNARQQKGLRWFFKKGGRVDTLINKFANFQTNRHLKKAERSLNNVGLYTAENQKEAKVSKRNFKGQVVDKNLAEQRAKLDKAMQNPNLSAEQGAVLRASLQKLNRRRIRNKRAANFKIPFTKRDNVVNIALRFFREGFANLRTRATLNNVENALKENGVQNIPIQKKPMKRADFRAFKAAQNELTPDAKLRQAKAQQQKAQSAKQELTRSRSGVRRL